MFYSSAVRTTAVHRVDRYLELVAAAGASNLLRTFPLPPGKAGRHVARGSHSCWLVLWQAGARSSGRWITTRSLQSA